MRAAWFVAASAWMLLGCDSPKPPPGPPVEQSATTSARAPAEAPVTPSVERSAAPEAEPETIAAQHVLIAYRGAKNAPRSVKRSKVEARKRAEEVLAKARAGEDFSTLAEQYSDDPTRTNRGNLGKFPRDQMVPEFAEPAFKLKLGEVSDVVETRFGFHVIKRNQ